MALSTCTGWHACVPETVKPHIMCQLIRDCPRHTMQRTGMEKLAAPFTRPFKSEMSHDVGNHTDNHATHVCEFHPQALVITLPAFKGFPVALRALSATVSSSKRVEVAQATSSAPLSSSLPGCCSPPLPCSSPEPSLVSASSRLPAFCKSVDGLKVHCTNKQLEFNIQPV